MQDILKKEKYDNSKFYNANVEWLADNDNKKAWDTMWLEVVGACTSTIKKFCIKVPGVYSIEDIEEFAKLESRPDKVFHYDIPAEYNSFEVYVDSLKVEQKQAYIEIEYKA